MIYIVSSRWSMISNDFLGAFCPLFHCMYSRWSNVIVLFQVEGFQIQTLVERYMKEVAWPVPTVSLVGGFGDVAQDVSRLTSSPLKLSAPASPSMLQRNTPRKEEQEEQ